MKNNVQKGWITQTISIALGLSTIAIVASIPIESNAIDLGTINEFKTIEGPETDYGVPMYFTFNPKYNSGQGTPQSKHYGSKKMWREVYPGGFVWYSPSPPPDERKSLADTDMAKMLENTQKVINIGDYKVPGISGKAYSNNLKLGSIDPWSHSYNGNNSGTKQLLAGDFKGKKYEWRYLGYDESGTVIENPYFPADVGQDRFNGMNRHQFTQEVANYKWISHSWELPNSQKAFGISKYNKDYDLKIKWIKEYFLTTYPEFKDVAKKQAGHTTLDMQAKFWANRLMPMNDPTKTTGVWLAWHENGGRNYYMTFVTDPPKQPNLRLTEFAIYEDTEKGEKLVAKQTRGNAYDKWEPKTTINNEFLSKGKTYTIKVKMKNMPEFKNDIKNKSITLDTINAIDGNVGNPSAYTIQKEKVKAKSPHEKNLKTNEVAQFEYKYTVPAEKKPKDKVLLGAKIPGKFYLAGQNTNTEDDDASIVLDIAPENLEVKFEGYYDDKKELVDYVTPNYPMYVKYRVTKTDGGTPIEGADLKIKLTDTKTVTKNQTQTLVGAYDKKGNPIKDSKLKKKGDYAVFWDSITPAFPKICTEGTIPSKWAELGVNSIPEDDHVKPACLANPDNIVVSNFVAKPETVFLSKNQSKKAVQYTVTFNLTNFNYDKRNKTIPLVYTIDGKIIPGTSEEVPVDSLKTMKISRVLPAVTVGEGEHIIQVEANPKPRKYVEVKFNSRGEEVDPYSDNIGWDKVNVQKNRNDFRCPVQHTTNYWNTTFDISEWFGRYEQGCSPNFDSKGNYIGCTPYTYPVQDWEYSKETVGFHEKQEIKNIFFRSKYTTDKQGGWVDLLNTKGVIKAGYGFELKVVTNYQTNTYNDSPKPFGQGNFWHGRNVSPQPTPVDSTARLKVTMPFTDDSGDPIALILDGNQTGHWSNTTTVYELEPRTVINKPERKMYINENTKDGEYNVRVETEPFYGSYDKPSTSSKLCDIRNVTIEVKGSYLDDVKTHVVQ